MYRWFCSKYPSLESGYDWLKGIVSFGNEAMRWGSLLMVQALACCGIYAILGSKIAAK
jgi:hypothetical protein